MNSKLITSDNELRQDAKLKTASVTLEDFHNLARDKSIYILSVNLEGMGLAKRLSRLGFQVGGFIDSRYKNPIDGLAVFNLDEFFNRDDLASCMLIVATKDRVWKKKSLEHAISVGFIHGKSLFTPLDLCPYFPTIEVAGKCNLVCKTCDMGLPGANKGRGHMTKETFRKVLEKLISEIPFLNSVALYTWGEPLVNSDIAEIIKIANEMGVATEVSSNLESHKYLDEFVLAEPGQIVAPCAGIGERYERGRTGGTWDNYLKGLKRISELKRKHGLNISLRIMYHIYKDNLDSDYDEIQVIAKELGFLVIPIVAHLFPGQVLRYAVSGHEIPEVMRDAESNLVFSLDDQLRFAEARKDKPCHILQAFPTIAWDGRVLLCCNMQKPFVGNKRYLDASLSEFIDIRDKSPFCTKCMNAGIHRFFDVNMKLQEGENGREVIRL